MSLLKKSILVLMLALSCFSTPVFAATSVLPSTNESLGVCDTSNANWGTTWELIFQDENALKTKLEESSKENIQDILGCAMKTGNVQFWMIPYFVVFALEFVIEVAGLLIVLMILVGAYYYVAGALTDDKEKGKTIITYAIIGFVVVLSSWALVNIILLALTS
jgi:hypothetical protein